MFPPWLRFHIPLIEPDRQISRIRLSDKTSRLRVQRHLQLLNTYVNVAARLHLLEIILYFGDDASFRTTIWQKASLWLIRCTRCALLVQSAGCAIGPSADADSRQDAGALRRSGT